jgi:hypothetical protein
LGLRRAAVALASLAFVCGSEARVGVIVNRDLWASSVDVSEAVQAYVDLLRAQGETVWRNLSIPVRHFSWSFRSQSEWFAG